MARTVSDAPQITPAQLREVERLTLLLRAEGKRVCVHWNSCRCCVSVHEQAEHITEGYVVGRDGGSDWLQL